MILLSDNTMLLIHADGHSSPFDPAALEKEISSVCRDSGLERDIALAVEYALRKQSRDKGEQCFKRSEVDSMIIAILEGVGMTQAAEEFRKNSSLKNDIYRIPVTRMEFFLAENSGLSGETLKLIASKVVNTLKAIGADTAEPALVSELAKHFVRLESEKEHLPYTIVKPDFRDAAKYTVTSSEIESELSAEAQVMISKRIIALHTMDLRIFQAVRADIRLTGIAAEAELTPPMTELALAEHLMRTASVLDEICLAADKKAREKAFDSGNPVKLIVHFTDASIFTRDMMACPDTNAQEQCAAELCRMLSSMLTRRPVKFTSA